jgi:hypothetical protein
MDIIEQLKEQLKSGDISIADVQNKLRGYMLRSSGEVNVPTESNKIEAEANKLDNDIELIVFGSKDENQVKETLEVLDRASLILKSRGVL